MGRSWRCARGLSQTSVRPTVAKQIPPEVKSLMGSKTNGISYFIHREIPPTRESRDIDSDYYYIAVQNGELPTDAGDLAGAATMVLESKGEIELKELGLVPGNSEIRESIELESGEIRFFTFRGSRRDHPASRRRYKPGWRLVFLQAGRATRRLPDALSEFLYIWLRWRVSQAAMVTP